MEKMKLKDLINIRTGKLDANASSENGKYPFFTCSKETLKINTYSYDCECVLLAGNGDLNVKYYNGKFDAYQRTYILECKNDIISTKYLYYFMKKYLGILRNQSIGGVIKYIKLANISEAIIPIYSKEEQEEIVNNISKVEEVLNIKNKQMEELQKFIKSQFVEMFDNKNYPKIRLKEVLVQDQNVEKIENTRKEKFVTVGINGKGARERIIKDEKWPVPFVGYRVKGGQFIYSRIDARNGAFAIIPNYLNNAVVSKDFPIFDIDYNKIKPDILLFSLLEESFIDIIKNSSFGATNRQRIKERTFLNYKIYLPPITLQNQFSEIVKQIDKQKFESMIQLKMIEKIYNIINDRRRYV